ncbi:hypothetical protein HNQ91_004107 [Filimonas zeae]|uniref:Uncharacterized protein n=1 Tax=Filimonas zeae TaxID=1737353 RepID=A0A917J4E7_9BACT|nr:hypothetical protein [Filimonas zeae]MDR6341034.1 hypothetical protein [Filimonas zeae]GGH77490.1 hypothetical protein GCM10011379_43920 [Filimonas zeae]
MKGRVLYDIIIIAFIIAFMGYTLFAYIDELLPVWMGAAAVGIIAFAIRIKEGHD